MALTFERVTQRFGDYVAVKDISLSIAPRSFTAVAGPSGCGKSTLLNLGAGLLAPTSGRVLVDDAPLRGLNRNAGYLFQQDGLLPWKTVEENIALGLELRGLPSAQAAREWIDRVGLQGFGAAYPAQLSGGMKKRAAMAQSFICDPEILLMDEPFSALDVHTRLRMQGVLLDLWTASPKTVLFVTHDLEEAIALADEVVVLSAGPASRVVGCHKVDLPRPRDLLNLRADPSFGELYGRIWDQLRGEVLESYARTR